MLSRVLPTCAGGTGRIFTISALQSVHRLRKHKVIAVATFTVAASLLEYGWTAHFLFEIPFPCPDDNFCNMSLVSKVANQLRRASLIISDEIVIFLRYIIEGVDRKLRVIVKSINFAFGEKCVVFRGDFRQMLPIVPRGSRGMILRRCF